MMSKLRFTAYWSAEEAETIMAFLDELKETIALTYEVELREMHQAENELNAKSEEHVTIDFSGEDPF